MQNNPDMPRFMQVQYAFAAHIRDPQKNPRPADVETRRMNIYNELFYNNIEDFMRTTFPVLRSVCGDQKWHRLIRDYFASHLASTPLFHEMPREFVRYLEQERTAASDDYPFMLELAHYEWVELALSVSEQEPVLSGIDQHGDLLSGIPVLSPLAWPLCYQFPVQQISAEFKPARPAAQPTYIVVYRNREDEVHFLEINPVTAHLLQLINEDQARTGQQLLEIIAAQLHHPNPQDVIQAGTQILNEMRERDILLGVKKS